MSAKTAARSYSGCRLLCAPEKTGLENQARESKEMRVVASA